MDVDDYSIAVNPNDISENTNYPKFSFINCSGGINSIDACRICLQTSNGMVFLENFVELNDGTNLFIPDIILTVTSVSVRDETCYPTMICLECLEMLKIAYIFTMRFKESTKLLEEGLRNNPNTDTNISSECNDNVVDKKPIINNALTSNLINSNESSNSIAVCNIAWNDLNTDTNISNEWNDNIVNSNKSSDRIAVRKRAWTGPNTDTNVSNECYDNDSLNSNIFNSNKSSNNVAFVKVEEVRSKSVENLSELLDNDALNMAPEKDPALHMCPICRELYTALELREHIKLHKSLKKYLNIPIKFRVSKKTRFIANASRFTNTTSISDDSKRNYKCPYCLKPFTALELRKHQLEHQQEKWFQCDQCPKTFRSINILDVHQSEHLKNAPYKCQICDNTFGLKQRYLRHLGTHTNKELPAECPECKLRFKNLYTLKQHILTCKKSIGPSSLQNLPFKCEFCLKVFDLKDSYVSHLIYHSNCKTPYECKHCKKQFAHLSNLNRHVKICNKPSIRGKMANHRCKTCLQLFYYKSELSQHSCKYMNSNLTTFNCSYCDNVYSHYKILHNHIKNEHKDIINKVLCPKCGIYSTCIYSHMAKHTGIKPFACTECDKSFSTEELLQNHVKVHTDVKSYQCLVCHKIFQKKVQLRKHMTVHTEEMPFMCSACGKKFKYSHSLKVHERTHKNVSKYVCNVCLKRFSTKSYLKKHMTTHNKKTID